MPCNYVVIIFTQPALPRGEATVIFKKYATKQILRTVWRYQRDSQNPNDQKEKNLKRTNNDPPNIMHKTKDVTLQNVVNWL